MAINLIVMLTLNDMTVKNAQEVFDSCADTRVKCWGFKDVGLPEREMARLVKAMKKNGVFPAGGQEQLKGKIVRIGLIGYLDEYDVLAALSGLELSLREVAPIFMGVNKIGESVKAAQTVLCG